MYKIPDALAEEEDEWLVEGTLRGRAVLK